MSGDMHVGGSRLPQEDFGAKQTESSKKLSLGNHILHLFRGETSSSKAVGKVLEKPQAKANAPITSNRNIKQLLQSAYQSILQIIRGKNSDSEEATKGSRVKPLEEPIDLGVVEPLHVDTDATKRMQEGVSHMIAFLGDKSGNGFSKQSDNVKGAALEAYFGKTGGDQNSHMMSLLQHSKFINLPLETKNAVYDAYLARGGEDAGKNMGALVKIYLSSSTNPDSILRGNTVEKLITRFYENRLGNSLKNSEQFRALLDGAKQVKNPDLLQNFCENSWSQIVDFLQQNPDRQVSDMHKELHDALKDYYSVHPSKEISSHIVTPEEAPRMMVANVLFLRLVTPAIFNSLSTVQMSEEKEALKNLAKVLQNLANLAGSKGGGGEKAAARGELDPIPFSGVFVDAHRESLLQLGEHLAGAA